MAVAVPIDVELTREPRAPVDDSTAGVALGPAPPRGDGTPRHRLVAVGDSLAQGFQSGAISRTGLSYPAIVAHELGWLHEFRRPEYEGFGGLPLNLEALARDLQERFGDHLAWWELPAALARTRRHLAVVSHYWQAVGDPSPGPINHNLAIYGWDLRDVLQRTAATAARGVTAWPHPHLLPLVRGADVIAARRALAGALDEDGAALTPLRAAAALGAEGSVEDGTGDGIETLLVGLGANNALAAVLGLRVAWSGPGHDDLDVKHAYSVWRPTHFAAELELVAAEVRAVRARHVVWTTVPHVTIAPVARGVGDPNGEPYYPFYTRPWIGDDEFDPGHDPHITGAEAHAIDCAVDQYNVAIVDAVRAARRDGLDWRVADIAGVLDRLASRRYLEDGAAPPPSWWTPYELPDALRALDPPPNTRFFATGANGRTAGGLFSLDGCHPTTIGYGLSAREIVRVMVDCGVEFRRADGTPRTGPIDVDFQRLLARDTLVGDPPRAFAASVAVLGLADEAVDLLRRLWPGI